MPSMRLNRRSKDVDDLIKISLLSGGQLRSEMTARGRRPLTRMFEQWRGRLPEFAEQLEH